jgi:hypothetical protein
MANRKAAEAFLYEKIEAIEGGTHNVTLYKRLFSEMSDKDFEAFIERLEREEIYLSILVPNDSKVKITAERSMRVGESLGIEFFQPLILTDPITGETYETPDKYLVIHIPVRRQNQHLIKKMSVPDNVKVVDQLSGQVTGESKGSKISLPELLVLESRGFEDNLLEMIKVRGGDEKAYRAMIDSIEATGGFSLKPILDLKSKPTSTETLRALLLSIHYDTTLGK